eukprot:scaffold16520_cov151-Skeletonema_marinoi.AAC.1
MSDLGTKSSELLKAALGEEEYSQLKSDMGTAGGTKSQKYQKASLGEEEYSQRMSDLGTAGGTKSQKYQKASLGEEEYSQLKSDVGKKGGLVTAEAKMKKNLTDGKSVHVIQCIDDSGQEGCAGETWMIGCRKEVAPTRVSGVVAESAAKAERADITIGKRLDELSTTRKRFQKLFN